MTNRRRSLHQIDCHVVRRPLSGSIADERKHAIRERERDKREGAVSGASGEITHLPHERERPALCDHPELSVERARIRRAVGVARKCSLAALPATGAPAIVCPRRASQHEQTGKNRYPQSPRTTE